VARVRYVIHAQKRKGKNGTIMATSNLSVYLVGSNGYYLIKNTLTTFGNANRTCLFLYGSLAVTNLGGNCIPDQNSKLYK
jgi:hypothetical protein